MQKLTTDPELMGLLGPSSEFSEKDLEAQLIEAGGARDAIIVWAGHNLIIDGHRRYKLCLKHNLPYEVVEVDLPDKKAVKEWIIRNQCGRRNLTPAAEARYLAQLATASSPKAAAQQAGVSERKVFRAKAMAEIHDLLDESVRRKVEGMRAGLDVLKEFTGLPLKHQTKIVRQVESGEFSSLCAAVKGEESTPKTDNMSAKPTVDYYKLVIEQVGKLKCVIDRLEQLSPSHRHQQAIHTAGQVETIIDKWKAEA